MEVANIVPSTSNLPGQFRRETECGVAGREEVAQLHGRIDHELFLDSLIVNSYVVASLGLSLGNPIQEAIDPRAVVAMRAVIGEMQNSHSGGDSGVTGLGLPQESPLACHAQSVLHPEGPLVFTLGQQLGCRSSASLVIHRRSDKDQR